MHNVFTAIPWWIKWPVIILAGLIVLLHLASELLLRSSDNSLRKAYRDHAYQPEIHRYKVGTRSIRYLEVGETNKPPILFVHGAPGGLWDYSTFLKDSAILDCAHLFSVDRLGYGHSGLGKAETSIEKQSNSLKPLLDAIGRPVILVGHSYGGPIVAQMAIDFPDQVASVILVAPAIDPEHEKIFGISYPTSHWSLRWLVPRAFRVANAEKLSHQEELRKMIPLWPELRHKTTLLHGTADRLVPIENAEFGRRVLAHIPADIQIVEGVNHLIPFQAPELMKSIIMKHLSALP